MNERQFRQLRHRAQRNEAPAEILAAVELEPGLVTRGSEGNGRTMLHKACSGGHVDLARDLVDRQADVHQRDTGGYDALMFASYFGHIPVMEFLLSRGADMTARNNNGNTALGFAAFNDNLPACKYLISRGSDLMAKNNKGKTALDIYGRSSSIDPPTTHKQRKQRRKILSIAFAEGPHISQVRRRNWERRRFLMIAVSAYDDEGIALQPLAYRKVLMLLANPQLPHNVPIPPMPAGTAEQRHAILIKRIFGIDLSNEGIFKLIMSFV